MSSQTLTAQHTDETTDHIYSYGDMPLAVCWHDHRGQGNLWEAPGAGQPWNGAPPVASGQPSSSTGPKARQPTQEQPIAAAFNMDDELLELEQQTKVSFVVTHCFQQCNSMSRAV